MLRVYGTKIDTNTGEVLKENVLIFLCISENDLKNKGIINAIENGYKITKIIKIGSIENHFKNEIIYQF